MRGFIVPKVFPPWARRTEPAGLLLKRGRLRRRLCGGRPPLGRGGRSGRRSRRLRRLGLRLARRWGLLVGTTEYPENPCGFGRIVLRRHQRRQHQAGRLAWRVLAWPVLAWCVEEGCDPL